jgi:hypothetical protein
MVLVTLRFFETSEPAAAARLLLAAKGTANFSVGRTNTEVDNLAIRSRGGWYGDVLCCSQTRISQTAA